MNDIRLKETQLDVQYKSFILTNDFICEYKKHNHSFLCYFEITTEDMYLLKQLNDKDINRVRIQEIIININHIITGLILICDYCCLSWFTISFETKYNRLVNHLLNLKFIKEHIKYKNLSYILNADKLVVQQKGI